MIDIRQSKQYADYLSSQGWIVERINNTNYFIKKFPIIGSILKLQRPEKLNLKEVQSLVDKYRSFQIIIEPKNESQADILASNSFGVSKSPFLPTKTLKIDLRQSQKIIFSHFKKDARQAIKRGEGILVKEYSTPKEIEIFQEAWRKSVNYSRYVPTIASLINLRKSFPRSYSIFLASHNIVGSIIGGVIFTRSSHDIAYYWQAFTNIEGRTSLSQYPLLYQGILWAKQNKCKVFDFEGIYDARFPNKSWLGFTHFKRSFGGYELEYPGTYVKKMLPFKL